MLATLTAVGAAAGLLFFWERLTNSATLAHRLTIWASSFALWREYPWVGVGPGGFFWHYPAYLPIGALDEPNLYHPHNLWLEFATGWGVLGLIWLGLLLWFLIRQAERVRREGGGNQWCNAGLLASLAAGLAHAQVDAFLLLPDLALWLWLVLALLRASSLSERKRIERGSGRLGGSKRILF